MLDWIAVTGGRLGDYLLGGGFAYNPTFLLTSCALAMVYWSLVKPGGSLLGFLFPKELYAHPSTRVDVAMTVFNALFIGLGGLSFVIFAPAVATGVMHLFAPSASGGIAASMNVSAAILLVTAMILIEDFCRYLIHFTHHKLPVLWPFHAVHHSAQVLTPVTFFRAHPLYFYLQQCLIATAVGAAQGIAVALTLGRVPAWTFVIAAIVSRVYLLAGVHLRHSHIPLRYGRVLEHVLISPRQHQVHHSVECRHYDRNFGEIFALWDWMFGTLYIPEAGETFDYGLTDEQGAKIQPYPTFGSALFLPFAQSAKALRHRGRTSDSPTTTVLTETF